MSGCKPNLVKAHYYLCELTHERETYFLNLSYIIDPIIIYRA